MEPLVLAYAIRALPPSALGRRWRWELWDGAVLLAAGWRFSETRARQAVDVAAGRHLHRVTGVAPLRPSHGSLDGLCVLRALPV